MASQRPPVAGLIGEGTRTALRRRGAELLGLGLIATAVVLAALLASYSPDDPSPFNATGDAPQNRLGVVGAHLAGALMFSIGWAAAALPLGFAVWGLRFIVHRGEERALTRTLLLLLGVLVLAAFLSSHVPPASWAARHGLGGAVGDSALRTLLTTGAVDPVAALPYAIILLGALALLMMALGLGMNWAELRSLLGTLASGMRLLALLCLALFRLILRGIRSALRQALRRRTSRDMRPEGPNAAGGRGTVFAAEAWAEGAGIDEAARGSLHLASSDTAVPNRTANQGRSIGRTAPEIAQATSAAMPEERRDVGSAPGNERLMARIAAAMAARRTDAEAPGPSFDAGADIDAAFGSSAEADDGVRVPRLGPVIDRLAERAEGAAAPKPVVRHRSKPGIRPSRRARTEAQPDLPLEETHEAYDAPPLSLLSSPEKRLRQHMSTEALEENARLLEGVLEDYGIRGEITAVRPGPVVTLYELEPAPGLKAARVIGLADDIARSMSALSARIATVPGRSVIGIELPNMARERVLLREILASAAFGDSAHPLPLALGKDIGGEPVVANLARMPHLLIAGTTGSGKSVAINTMILSLLYRLSPAECRLIMIDPKMLELSVYDGIPHLLSPVVTDPKKAVVALKWVVGEMEERYRKMSKLGVRNIEGYNARVRDALSRGDAFSRVVQTGFDETTGEPIFEEERFDPEAMPYIVVIVDEMADLMMVSGKEIEACIQRLAQMARASGIHLIMATQRPSVDVITGTIKANFPTRISFQVTSKIDSRTILGEQGAEQLLGQGDMLYMAGGARIARVHGPFCSDEEVEEVVAHLKLTGAPDYVAGVIDGPDEEAESEIDLVLGLGGNPGGEDALYDQAVAIVAQDRKCSTSYIQRKLGIGYNKAARLVEQMEDQGVVGAANQVGKREILIPER
ncbi:MAG: DNA translocase FtsK 4TM domain-containing protein [Pseudomonadota bacterium]